MRFYFSSYEILVNIPSSFKNLALSYVMGHNLATIPIVVANSPDKH